MSTGSVHVYSTKMTVLHAASYQDVQLTNMLTHADVATSIQSVAYDSNIHGQSCERLHFQEVDLVPVLFRNGTTESSPAVTDV
jgi:hypothetical protein